MIVKSYDCSLTASFFIARVGQVGKPMWTPYTSNNSFMVFSDNKEADFQRVKAAYEAKAFEYYAHGSVQPSIRIGDVRKVIAQCVNMDERHLNQMAALEQYIALKQKELDKQRKLLRDLQRSMYANC
ncbi:DUF6943 family protein [Vibrio coralliilyticus]|uniref:DUF6943 family protein n=1 Tax=Vibrio coralliilyticus TaxID=190893 RepID=UPI00211E9C08|nr:hypothetical protein [Vibrio coralliilyticus]